MDSLKCDDQDPDYFMIFDSDINRQNIFEKNARINTSKKISTIIETEFLNEINHKKTEIYQIYKNLNNACKMLHYLRFAIVTDFYNQENICNNDIQSLKQSRLHFTVTPFTSKKTSVKEIGYENNCFEEFNENIKRKKKSNDTHKNFRDNYTQNEHSESIMVESSLLSTTCKIKKRIIVGNISKWILPDFRDGNASHKWTIYIRDSNKCDIGTFISKVRFFLHPSYKPNDVVELSSAPFHLSRHGWGEFPVRVQLHFTNSFNKPVDIIHYLKLDRTFTGLQTIGSETIVDLWINMKDTLTLPGLKESNNQNNFSISDKYKKSYLIENNYFLNDHNYMGINVRLDEKTYIQKTQSFTNSALQISQSNIELEKYSTFNLKIEMNESSKKSDHFDILSKTDSEQLLIENLNDFEQNVLNSINKHKYECLNVQNLQNNSYVDNKKIDFKDDSYINIEENFKALVNLIEYTNPRTLFDILKFIMKKLPLINEKLAESSYKIIHPYASETLEQFYNYSKGKQQSLERYRAIYALNVIRSTKYYDATYNTNELIKWARRFCYTPFLNFKNIHKICTLNKPINTEDQYRSYEYTSTISDQLNKWLLQYQEVNLSFINFNSESNDQIDILNIPLNISDSLSMYQDNSKDKKDSVILIEYPETDNILNEFVCKSMQKIGIKLMNEEIIPGVLHHTANLVMTKAIEYLVDDLVRLAFSCALDKTQIEKSTIFIKLDDVRMALLKKEEFEIFTNAGLGSEG